MYMHSEIRESLLQFNEEACRTALFSAKWPHGFRCPRCDHSAYYLLCSRKKYECRSCAHQTSLISGTIMEGTRTPLAKWFQALHLMRIGISAKLLSELIQVTYKTAWLINHKLRHAIGIWDEARLLEGDLELFGEFYARPYYSYFDSRIPLECQEQPCVLGASVQADTGEVVEIKIKRFPLSGFTRRTFSDASFQPFLTEYADTRPSSRSTRIVGRSGAHGRTALGIIWEGAVRWLARTFGGIGSKHLQAYLDEFCFRYSIRTDLFESLVRQCGMTPTVTYRALVGKDRSAAALGWNYANFSTQKASPLVS
ncbi:IS1595 family transposase [Cohnella sp. 56]|uniref:IS1595 family transposase n=1 Tax=Cohnella sp. 56 TaxID=3113722 RepID=UPI0030EA95C8